MEGQGRVRASRPPPTLTSSPLSVFTSAVMPGNVRVADPGLQVVIPGRGVIMIAPVSVCHHVSTTGHRLPPMYSWYHIHASGLIGSPTEPSSLREERSRPCGHSSPHRMKARIAV